MKRLGFALILSTLVLAWCQCRTTRPKHYRSDASTEDSLPEKVQKVDSIARGNIEVYIK